MAYTTRIDWHKAQQDYVGNRTMSYAKIAYKYGVSETTVKEHAAEMGWMKMRESVDLKIAERLPEKIAESVASFQARKFHQGKQITDRAMAVLTDPTTKISARTAKEMIDTGFTIQTQALGLDTKDKPGDTTNVFVTLPDFLTMMEKKRQERTPTIDGEEVKP